MRKVSLRNALKFIPDQPLPSLPEGVIQNKHRRQRRAKKRIWNSINRLEKGKFLRFWQRRVAKILKKAAVTA